MRGIRKWVKFFNKGKRGEEVNLDDLFTDVLDALTNLDERVTELRRETTHPENW